MVQAYLFLLFMDRYNRIFFINADISSTNDKRNLLPFFHELDLISGNGKTVEVMELVAAKWEKVATRLHFDGAHISRIRQDSHLQAESACRIVFTEWLQGKGREPKTWNTVIEVLKEMKLSELAHNLEDVLA